MILLAAALARTLRRVPIFSSVGELALLFVAAAAVAPRVACTTFVVLLVWLVVVTTAPPGTVVVVTEVDTTLGLLEVLLL